MINKDQAHLYFSEMIKNIDLSNTEKYQNAFMEYMKYLAENYDDLDGEMREVYDKSKEIMLALAKENLDKSSDSIEKRQGIRLIKKAKRKHYDINELIQILERPKNDLDGIFHFTRELYKKIMQKILDFLSDISDHSFKYTTDKFAIFGLFYLIIDELLAAFHLSQHSFINQADTHIRTVLENLDKIELFYKKPEWANLWVSEDPKDKKRKWEQLKPSAVRIKLGKSGHSDLYSILSELGTHSEFKSIQTRSAIENDLNEKGNLSLVIWIGGCPYEHNIIFTNSFLLYTLVMTLLCVTTVFEDFLLDNEVENTIDELFKDIKVYNEKYFIPWAVEESFDITPFNELLKRSLWDEN